MTGSDKERKTKRTTTRKSALSQNAFTYEEPCDSQYYLSFRDASLTTVCDQPGWDKDVSHTEFVEKLKSLVEAVEASQKSPPTSNDLTENVGPSTSQVEATPEGLSEEEKDALAALRQNQKPVIDWRSQPNNIRSSDLTNPTCSRQNIASVHAPGDTVDRAPDKSGSIFGEAFPFKAFAAGAGLLAVLTLTTTACYLTAFSSEKTAGAVAYLSKGDYQSALGAASLAVKCNPFSAAAYFARGRAQTSLLCYTNAQESFNRALELAPNDKAILDAHGALSLKMKKPDQAIKDLKKLIALSGNKLKPYQYGNLAIAYYQTGKQEEALQYYTVALKADPKSDSLQLGLAYTLAAKLQFQDSLSLCNRLVEQYPTNHQALALRGYCRQRLGDLDGATRDMDKALSLAPEFSRGYAYRAALSSQKGNRDQALKDYTKLADLERDDDQAQHTAAKMLLEAGHKREAQTYYKRLSLMCSFRKNPEQVIEKANLDFELGTWPEAIKALKTALSLKPEARLYKQLAVCYARSGQAREARESLSQAIALSAASKAGAPDTESKDYLRLAAQVEQLLGNSVSAIDKYSQILAAAPRDKEALANRAELYMHRQQWASAAQDYQKALSLGCARKQLRANLEKCSNILEKRSHIDLDLPKNLIIDLAALTDEQLHQKAYASYKAGEVAMAALYFGETARRNPSDIQVRRYLAHSLAAAGEHEQAIRNFNMLATVIKLDSVDKLACAKACAAIGRYDEAIGMMDRARREDRGNLDLTLALAKILSASGKIDQAITVCKSSAPKADGSHAGTELNNLYQSLLTQKQRAGQNNKEQDNTASTEG